MVFLDMAPDEKHKAAGSTAALQPGLSQAAAADVRDRTWV